MEKCSQQTRPVEVLAFSRRRLRLLPLCSALPVSCAWWVTLWKSRLQLPRFMSMARTALVKFTSPALRFASVKLTMSLSWSEQYFASYLFSSGHWLMLPASPTPFTLKLIPRHSASFLSCTNFMFRMPVAWLAILKCTPTKLPEKQWSP